MKHQQVSVDYWTMGKAMLMYIAMTVMGWIMLRLLNTIITFPRRMRSQQANLQNTLDELQRRFPDMNITEEDLKNAEKELEELVKEEKKDEILADEKEEIEIEKNEDSKKTK